MADVSRPRLRGFIVPDIDLAGADSIAAQGDGTGVTSTYTQADPEPGIPVATSSPTPDLTLRTHGTAGSSTYKLQIARNGYPGRESRDAGFFWKETGDTRWIGWDRPFPRGYQGINVREDSDTQADIHPHAITLRYNTEHRGRVVAVTMRTGTDPAIAVQYQDPGQVNWTTVDVEENDGDVIGQNWPTIIELPTGRIVAYYWDDGGNFGRMVRASYSDDGGESWSVYASNVLPVPLEDDYVGGVLRAAYSAGEVLLLVLLDITDLPAPQHVLMRQYASGDDGSNFDYVTGYWGPSGDIGDFQFNSFECCPTLGGGFAVAWTECDLFGSLPANPEIARSLVLGSAYEPIYVGNATRLEQEALRIVVYSDASLCCDDDGTIWWILARSEYSGVTRDRTVLALRSTDGGQTYENPLPVVPLGYLHALWGRTDEDNDRLVLIDFAATWAAGQLVLVTRWIGQEGLYGSDVVTAGMSVASSDDYSIGAIYCGGYSTSTDRLAPEQETGRHAWVGMISPGADEGEWDQASVGTPSQTVETGGILCELADTDALTWSNVPEIEDDQLFLEITGGLRVDDGGDHNTKSVHLRATISNGIDSEYKAEVWIGQLGYTVRDVIAGTSSSLVAVDTTQAVDVRLSINQDGEILVEHRTEVSPGAAVHRWTIGYQGSLTQKTSSVSAAGSVSFGTSAGVETTVLWKHVEWRSSSILYALPAATVDLLERRITADPVELHAGYCVSAVDGPAIRGNQWDLGIRYRHGIERIDPTLYPSPRAGWRSEVSEDETVPEQIITWRFGPDATRWLRGSWAIYLDGLNWRFGRLQGWDGAAWNTIVEIDTAIGRSGLAYVRTGNTLTVDTEGSGDASRWWAPDALAGCTVVLDEESHHTAVSNTSGLWKVAGTGVRPEIRIDGVTGDEEPDGSCDVWSTRWVGVIHNATDYSAIRLVIDEDVTVTGDFRIGVAELGPLIVIDEHEWGSAIETQPNVVLNTRADGSRSTRRLGPPRRSLTMAWPNGIPARATLGTITAHPDYLSAAGVPLAAPAAAASDLEGLILRTDGPALPVVYLPTVERSDSSYAYTARELAIYGRLTSSVSQELVVGDEDQTEVRRVLQLTLDEEV